MRKYYFAIFLAGLMFAPGTPREVLRGSVAQKPDTTYNITVTKIGGDPRTMLLEPPSSTTHLYGQLEAFAKTMFLELPQTDEFIFVCGPSSRPFNFTSSCQMNHEDILEIILQTRTIHVIRNGIENREPDNAYAGPTRTDILGHAFCLYHDTTHEKFYIAFSMTPNFLSYGATTYLLPVFEIPKDEYLRIERQMEDLRHVLQRIADEDYEQRDHRYYKKAEVPPIIQLNGVKFYGDQNTSSIFRLRLLKFGEDLFTYIWNKTQYPGQAMLESRYNTWQVENLRSCDINQVIRFCQEDQPVGVRFRGAPRVATLPRVPGVGRPDPTRLWNPLKHKTLFDTMLSVGTTSCMAAVSNGRRTAA